MKQKIFLIAGSFDLPLMVLNKVKHDYDVFVFDFSNRKTEFDVQNYFELSFKNSVLPFKQLKKERPQYIVMAGAVKFTGIKDILLSFVLHPIWFLRILFKVNNLKIKGDDGYLNVLEGLIENEFGTKFLSPHDLNSEIILFNDINPEKAKKYHTDIQLGTQFINAISAFDMGQSVVVQEGRVIAAEAQEGTSEMILRCEKILLNSGKAVLIKKTKINQNLTFDMPTIGIETVKNTHTLGFAGIAIEKNKTIVLNQEKIIKFLKDKEFFIVSI